MSINSMANAAAARRPDTFPLGTVPRGFVELGLAATTPPRGKPIPEMQGTLPSPGKVDTALSVVFGHIPTEIVTLYVAVIAAIDKAEAVTFGDWAAFWFFFLITPVVLWLVFAGKLRAAGMPLPSHPRAWPVWEMTAATVAFGAWAFGLPNSPFSQYAWYSSAISGLVILLASTGLGLVAPIFQRPLPP